MIKYFKKINKKKNKKRISFFVFSFFIIFILFSQISKTEGAINKEINYQGKLTTSASVAVPNGTYNMEFKLYTVLSGGSAIWTETRTTTDRVTLSNGLFSVMLGDVSTLASVNFNQTLYLGVNIGGTDVTPVWDGEMSPRKKLGSVPASVISEKTTNIIGGNSTTELGSIPYQSDTDTTTLLSPNTTTTKKFFRMTGTGTNGAAPAWDTVTATDVGLGNVTNESKATMFASPTFTGSVTMPGTGIWNSSGNVGIGTITPTSKLYILQSGTAANNYGIYSYAGGAGTNNYAGYFDALNGTGNNYAIFANTGNVVLNATSGTTTIGSLTGVLRADSGLVSVDSNVVHTSDLSSYLPLAGGTMSGNIVMGNNGTIGQAAGPLLNFDDTNNYLEITGANVGIGTATPSEKIEVIGNIYINNSGGYLKFYNGFKFTDGTANVTVTDSGGNTIMVFDEL